MKADLHVHTNYSYDGFSSPQKIVEAAIRRKIDCICITDHNEIKGAIEAMRFAFDKNILVIPGIEILSSCGDVLGINVKKIIPDGLSIEQTIKEIRKQGGMAIIPHPFDWPIENFLGRKEKLAFIGIDAIEVFNASVIFKSSNKKALNFSRENNLCFSAGSDAHRAEFVGRGYLETFKNINSEKELLEELKLKRVGIKGTPLNFWETLKNSSVNFKRIINYYGFKTGLKKEKKEENRN